MGAYFKTDIIAVNETFDPSDMDGHPNKEADADTHLEVCKAVLQIRR